MKLPQLTLRDLFWLVMIAGILIGWGLDHSRTATRLQALKQNRWPFFSSERSTTPSNDSIARTAALERLSNLTDAELSEHFSGLSSDGGWRHEGSEYQPCLTEMVRRGLYEDLQRHYDKLMADARTDGDFPDNLHLLIALRRAQGQPDPLKIHVEIGDADPSGMPSSIPQITATIENVDVGQESVSLSEGMDYRGGRSERWRVHLTDENSRQIPDSNFMTGPFGGGLGSIGPLAYGERGNWRNHLDARQYVQPPAPGKYQLQVVHSEGYIADEPNLEGLIVLTSEPVTVLVEKPLLVGQEISVIPLLGILGFGAVVAVAAGIRGVLRQRCSSNSTAETPRRKIVRAVRWRDMLALGLVTGLALAWLFDIQRLALDIQANQLDQDANWSIRLAE